MVLPLGRGGYCFAFAAGFLFFGCVCFFSASAMSRWRAGDAPVRGGTYFSLSPKGTSFGAHGKEK